MDVSTIGKDQLELLEKLDSLLSVITKRARSAAIAIPQQAIKKGVQLCLENSSRLLEDAKLLFDHKRYASAAHLASLSFEELGKGILIGAGWRKKRVSKERVRELFHTGSKGHLLKLRAPIERGQLIGVKSPEPPARIRQILESSYYKRNETIYVDWFVRAWKSPTELDDGEIRHMAQGSIDSTERLLKLAENNLTKTLK